jgi:hypothetical protein
MSKSTFRLTICLAFNLCLLQMVCLCQRNTKKHWFQSSMAMNHGLISGLVSRSDSGPVRRVVYILPLTWSSKCEMKLSKTYDVKHWFCDWTPYFTSHIVNGRLMGSDDEILARVPCMAQRKVRLERRWHISAMLWTVMKKHGTIEIRNFDSNSSFICTVITTRSWFFKITPFQ